MRCVASLYVFMVQFWSLAVHCHYHCAALLKTKSHFLWSGHETIRSFTSAVRHTKRGAGGRQLVLTWRPYDASISLDDRDIFERFSGQLWFLLQIHRQQQHQRRRQTSSRVWDVLLVYSHHFLQSRFTSAKHDTTGTTSKTRSMQSFIGRQIYLPPLLLLLLLSLSRSLSLSLTHSVRALSHTLLPVRSLSLSS